MLCFLIDQQGLQSGDGYEKWEGRNLGGTEKERHTFVYRPELWTELEVRVEELAHLLLLEMAV